MKRIKFFILLGVVTLFHSFLSLWSFGKLFGIGHMSPEDRPVFAQKVWGIVSLITWQPTLWLTHRIKIFDKFPWWLILTIINSAIAISIVYLLFKRKKRG